MSKQDTGDNVAGQKIVKQIPIGVDSVPGYQFFIDATVCIDGDKATTMGDDNAMHFEAVCEAYQEDVRMRLQVGSKLVEAAENLPEDTTERERKLVCDLEAEVDAMFGHNAHLYGRAVALYAIRDLAEK